MIEINYEELKQLKKEELTDKLQEKIEGYKKWVAENISTYEQAQEEEKKIIEKIDEFQDYLKNVIYTFKGGVTVNGKPIKDAVVFKYIQEFIDKMEVEFQYTKGLAEMYRFWGSQPKEVDYQVLESTLRTLQTCKFKGYDQWVKVLAINDFFAGVRGDSIKDTAFQVYWASIHNAIIDRSELLNPVKNSNEPVEGTFEG